ncbi:50S ribosomal protein L15 [bacterium]|nr:50S ribosomal protein L15 [bacterium]
MKLGNLKPPKGSMKSSKRVGRGNGSGYGKTSGRGEKGQKSRAGAKRKPWFEGGQMPFQRRIPKKGFKNPNRTEFNIINVKNLNIFEDGDEITPQVLKEKGLIKAKGPIKLLGDGVLKKNLKVKLEAISKSAKEKITGAGGTVEEL